MQDGASTTALPKNVILYMNNDIFNSFVHNIYDKIARVYHLQAPLDKCIVCCNKSVNQSCI